MIRPSQSCEPHPSPGSFLDSRLLPFLSTVVPKSRRADWTREWQAELWHLHRNKPSSRRSKRDFVTDLSLAQGLIADATWLRWDWLKESAPGSAGWCLTGLLAACLLCASMELVLAGSWRAFVHVLAAHFLGNYIFVMVPAIFPAMVTYPLKELRWERKGAQRHEFLSARVRWNLFFCCKITLTLALGFLATVVLSVLISVPARPLIGYWVDGIEFVTSALVVTISLRWALLNQERRCQKCVRLLCQPTRVGPPSRNFLDWSGTELACADGHGLLHVAEMQGSWCWYDRWVDLDPAWPGLSPV